MEASLLWDMGTPRQDMGAEKPQVGGDQRGFAEEAACVMTLRRQGQAGAEWEGAGLGVGKSKLLGVHAGNVQRVPRASKADPHSEVMGSL